MNVLRNEFLSKTKKSNIQKSKNPINYLSGYQTGIFVKINIMTLVLVAFAIQYRYYIIRCVSVQNPSAMWFFQYSSITNAPGQNVADIFGQRNSILTDETGKCINEVISYFLLKLIKTNL